MDVIDDKRRDTHTVKCHGEPGCQGEDTDCIDEGAEQWHNTLSLLQALSMFPEYAGL